MAMKLNYTKAKFPLERYFNDGVIRNISHKMGFTPFELLHMASSKMLARMNDLNYIAKN